MATGGPAAVAGTAGATYRRLSLRLPAENPERRITVTGGLAMTVAAYLRTRVVELVVHGDDLAVSVGCTFGQVPPAVATTSISTLVDVARVRHGDMPVVRSVVRALAGRERDHVQALRGM